MVATTHKPDTQLLIVVLGILGFPILTLPAAAVAICTLLVTSTSLGEPQSVAKSQAAQPPVQQPAESPGPDADAANHTFAHFLPDRKTP